MTPQAHPEIIEPLAAEYALGTLRGPARRRFERWRTDSALIQERCRFWEEHLMSLARGLRPIQPPEHVWQGIRARLNLSGNERPGGLPGQRAAQRPPAERRRSRMPALAIAASVLLIAGLASLLYWRSLGPGQLSEVASIASPTGQPIWQVEFYRHSGRLVVHTGQQPNAQAGHDFELWALPAGGKPVSLGLLPVNGTAQRDLTAAQRQALANASQIAVTVEQSGGSPTGQPTTTPIFVAPLRAVS